MRKVFKISSQETQCYSLWKCYFTRNGYGNVKKSSSRELKCYSFKEIFMQGSSNSVDSDLLKPIINNRPWSNTGA